MSYFSEKWFVCYSVKYTLIFKKNIFFKFIFKKFTLNINLHLFSSLAPKVSIAVVVESLWLGFGCLILTDFHSKMGYLCRSIYANVAPYFAHYGLMWVEFKRLFSYWRAMASDGETLIKIRMYLLNTNRKPLCLARALKKSIGHNY